MSGDCTESTLNFLFSGVFVDEFFLLKLVLFFSSSLKLSFFLGDSILMLDILLFIILSCGDIEGLFVFCGIKTCCTILTGVLAGDKLDVKETDLAGEDFGVIMVFFKLAGEVIGVFKLLFFLIGDDLDNRAISLDFVSMNCFSMLSNSPHSMSISISRSIKST